MFLVLNLPRIFILPQNPRSVFLNLYAMSSSSSSSIKIIAEYAKSSRSSCKKCAEKIDSKSLRLGLSTRDPRGFDNTKWHHLYCFFSLDSNSLTSAESIEGFSELTGSDQEKLKQLVSDGGHHSKKLDEDEKPEKKERNEKIEKTDNEETEQKQKNAKSEKVVAEYAKSGRSSCKKCAEKIDSKSLRLGLSSRDPRGFDNTKWHHLHCFFPLTSVSLSSAESIEGFSELKSSDQEKLKTLVSEGDQSSKKLDKVDETELAKRDEKTEKGEDVDTEPDRTNLKKQKPKDVDTERDRRNLKKQKTSESPEEGSGWLAFSSSDIKDHYKGATLRPKWKAFQTIIFLERDDGLQDSSKIAAFDFDGCLAKTSVQRVGADAWKLMYPSVPMKLQSLYNDGYKLVIFTNESNIDRWKNKRQAAVDSKIGRLDGFIKLVKVPIQVFIACGVGKVKGQEEDPFRKPQPGMWRIMEQHFNSGIPIDMDHSFYVGDAAGRKDDHSDADKKFAEAVGLKFYLPEEYFDA